ncbi:hypothetical protein JZO86_12790 [Enterococcus ureasiticus]|uniref:hypothetical protein n=1 Tax=Enterococcus ureasiticus TaxID=903984 RepID=UPI001A8F082F|nr:hypothetical protein [Enterococcus ureasiticus]MBO0474574.1 hypothetical protein [Enterococcus ureasiticus]
MMKTKRQRIYLDPKKYTTKQELITAIKKVDPKIEDIKEFDFEVATNHIPLVIEVKKKDSEQFQSISIQKHSFKKWLYLTLLIVLICTLGGYLWHIKNQEVLVQTSIIPSELAPDIKDAKKIDKNELIKKMQSAVDDGYFNLQMDTELIFNSAKENGKIQIINPEQNKSIIAVEVFLQEENDLIYESGSIYPGQYINKRKLAKDLAQGEYQAYAKAKIYDQKTKKEQTTSIVNLTIQVKN